MPSRHVRPPAVTPRVGKAIILAALAWCAAAAARRGWAAARDGLPSLSGEELIGLHAAGSVVAAVPVAALLDTLAAVALVASLWGLYRGRAATMASAQAASSADSGGSGGVS